MSEGIREAVLGQLAETGGGLMRPSLKRAALVVDQAIAYWGSEDVEELGTVTGFVLAVFAIDDEMDAGTPPDSAEAAHERYLPWRAAGAETAGHVEVQRMLHRAEGSFVVGEERAQLVTRWRLEGERMVTAMWREAGWRVSGRLPPEGDYLANGDKSVAIPWMAVTMAGLLGEVASVNDGPDGKAIDEAARACRLLNDVDSWERERGSGAANLVAVLMAARSGGRALSEGEAMRTVEVRLKAALERFYQTTDGLESVVVERIRRLVEVVAEHHEV